MKLFVSYIQHKFMYKVRSFSHCCRCIFWYFGFLKGQQSHLLWFYLLECFASLISILKWSSEIPLELPGFAWHTIFNPRALTTLHLSLLQNLLLNFTFVDILNCIQMHFIFFLILCVLLVLQLAILCWSGNTFCAGETQARCPKLKQIVQQ